MAPAPDETQAAGASVPRRLFVYSGGFVFQRRVRRILELAGWEVKLGLPGADDRIGVWGRSPYAARGEAMAEKTGAALVRIEDALLRSIHPGRADGEPPVGLLIDEHGVHFDSATPSGLERLLANHPLDDGALMARARLAMDRLKQEHLSKYNAFDPDAEVPAPGYVLVIDQTRGDASIAHGNATEATFREMLAFAQIEHPGARILIKTHPETVAGAREGHFGPEQEDERTKLYSDPVSPWALLEGAVAVYTVSSGMGFEAIIAGHKPRVFGQPFYGGWGLTADEAPCPRRERKLTRAQLFAAAMILYPTWYDPWRDRLASLEEVMDGLGARARAWREDRQGGVAYGMRLWKRKPLQRFFGAEKPLIFNDKPEGAAARAKTLGAPVLAWAGRVDEALEAATARAHVPLIRVEDGFLRSRGLGAELVPPLSLVRDDLGIYYDPRTPSRLEHLIARAARQEAHPRASALIAQLKAKGVSKYNLGSAEVPELPAGHRILVPGQVEDDASISFGTGEINTNFKLLQATREASPEAVILYKPHPDVEAGLRAGRVENPLEFADMVLPGTDPAALIERVDAVWTMTSGLGFEALIRGVPVTTLGAPFYAGWGLTEDRGSPPERREARPSLEALVQAVLIEYPRYFDPVTGTACPVEVVLDRLESGNLPGPGFGNRLLSKLQGWLAGYAHLWR
ncbi:capsular polysaccharide biosynthesis protein [Vannielia litorea]|uniref:capsular polysaccharide biosynthesis protein n=1 Tax=Vannielia litorea TaxID=1217970 RepID=UPI001C96A118|nr:capsular polysaccharide biosynthesis protein [Vannielia litorea]MBY6153498.1 capsular polysaccharide biosynthesis protein [Vannielia litorea]